MDLLNIWTLDGVHFALGERPLSPFKTRKVTALLIYLACERRAHAREHLMDLLWGGSTSARAANNLSIALSALRKVIAPYLVADRQTVGIAPAASLWIDAYVMTEALTARPEERLTRETAQKWRTAVALYRTEFLAGFHVRGARRFEEWALVERERLGRIVSERLFQLATFDHTRRQTTTGIALATRLVTMDPLNERAHRLLMRLHAADGQPGRALAQFEKSRHLLDAELGVAPDVRTVDLFEQIRAGRHESPATRERRSGHNIPPAPTPLVGRADDIAAIADRLAQPDCRLLTVVGAGGQGKTRLVREVGVRLVDHYPDGVCFVPLEGLATAVNIPSAIVDALDIPLSGAESPRERLLDYLADRSLLLILDNFEHLLDGVDLVAAIVREAPSVQLLVTSRERLNLTSEWLYPLAGLPVPAAVDVPVTSFPAGELFVGRAAQLAPSFAPERERTAVNRICQLVDGSPLALELAATWTRLYSCRQIVTAIEDGLTLLSTNSRDVPARHRSMTAVFDHSWRLLTPAEQETLAALSVCNGFTAVAAAEVAGADHLSLATLLEKSLIRRLGDERFELHPLLRQYAAAKLKADATAEQNACAAHGRFFASFLAHQGKGMVGSYPRAAITALTADIDNVRAAWHWSIAAGRLDLLGKMVPLLSEFLFSTGRLYEGRQLLGHLLDALPPDTADRQPALLVDSHTYAGKFVEALGEHYAEKEHFERARTVLESTRVVNQTLTLSRARLWHTWGFHLADHLSDYDAAERYYRRAEALYDELGDKNGLADVLSDATLLAFFRGVNEAMMEPARRARALYEMTGNVAGLAEVDKIMGMYTAQVGDFATAVRHFEAAERLQEAHGSSMMLTNTRYNRAVCLAFMGSFDASAELIRATAVAYREQGHLSELVHVESTLAFPLIHTGQYAAAQVQSESALDQSVTLYYKRGVGLNALFLTMAAQGRGRLAEALTWGTRGVAAYKEIDLRDELNSMLAIHTLTHLLAGRLETAVPLLHETLDLAVTLDTFHCRVESLAVVSLFLAQQEKAAPAAAFLGYLNALPFVTQSRWFNDILTAQLPPTLTPAPDPIPSDITAASPITHLTSLLHQARTHLPPLH